jgi:hypothetical protein
MSIPESFFTALTEIVGTRNVSRDPAVLDSYRYYLGHTAIHLGPFFDTFTPRGAAVVLPGSTPEVQAIVRLCNKYKVKYKASSTFWSAQGNPSEDDVLQLDMRRMDRILEIDEKNMYAVVEPGVIGATLQAETMKVGLNTHIPGIGCSGSQLAGATSYYGSGPSNMYGGFHHDNMLALEWVQPNGEILRTGSLGAGLGWSCGEGPGISMRGIARGHMGAKGAMGVFTKVALKLFPWPGPATLPVEGTIPAYRTSLPDNFRAYTLAWADWRGWADACQLIWETNIGYIGHRQFNMFGRDLKYAMVRILTDPEATLEDLPALLEDPAVQAATKDQKIDFQLIMAGQTMRDIEWQEQVLDEILRRTSGWKVQSMLVPEIRDWAMLYMIRLGHKNLNLVFGGGYDGCFGFMGPIDFGATRAEEAAAFKKEWEKKGAIVPAGGDCFMGPIGGMGGGGTGLWENFTCFDPHDKFSTEGTLEFFTATTEYGAARKWGGPMENMNAAARGSDGYTQSKAARDAMHLSQPQPNVFRYQSKVRAAFNPNDLGDQYYETLEE